MGARGVGRGGQLGWDVAWGHSCTLLTAHQGQGWGQQVGRGSRSREVSGGQ